MDKVNIYVAMAEGKPYKSFIKTIFGKVYVTVLSVEDETKAVGHILYGNPKSKEDSCIWDVWSEKQYQVFKRLNAEHLKRGAIVEYTRPSEDIEETKERSIVEYSDEELLKEVLSVPYMKFQKLVNSMDQLALVYRLHQLATDNDKPGRYVELLSSKLAELQKETQFKQE